MRYAAVVSRWYVAAALAAMVPLLQPALLAAALALLILHLSLIRPYHALYRLGATLLCMISLPPLAATLWDGRRWLAALPALAVIPVLPWLEAELRGAGASIVADGVLPAGGGGVRLGESRWVTVYGTAPVAGAVATVLVGTVAAQPAVWGAGLIVLAFLGTLITLALVRIPSEFVATQPPAVRVLARETVEFESTLRSLAGLPFGLLLEEGQRWVHVMPRVLSVDHADAGVRVRATPSLAGPSGVEVTAVAVDPWGMTALTSRVVLGTLIVIPRATYAAWLARRFLAQMEAGVAVPAAIEPTAQQATARRGIEYYGSRDYQPGDVLRDVMWKHTLKLHQLVVKDRREDLGEAVILVTDLHAENPEDADARAFTLLMAAMTLAREGIPTAFAAYTPTEVIRVTRLLSSRDTVLTALELIEAIRISAQPRRVLKPAAVTRLRRNIARLSNAGSAQALKLARLLALEYRGIEERARTHPAAVALIEAAAQVRPPAAIVVLSPAGDHDDVIQFVVERLAARGFRRIAADKPRPRLAAARVTA